MKNEYTAAQRRELAQKLREISDVLLRSDYDEAEDWVNTIDRAIALICPGFLEEEDAALEAELFSPEMDAFMDEMKKDPAYQKGLEEFKQLAQKVVPFPGKKKEGKDG